MPPPLGEVPRRGGEGYDVAPCTILSLLTYVATLSVTLTGASSPKGGAKFLHTLALSG